MPLLSIITINLNDARGLAATAESIEALAFRDFEWLVIDGQSTDDSLEVIHRARPARWVSEPDRGRYDAMNKGIRLAGGTYVLFMNSGDRFCDRECLNFLASSAEDKALIQGNAVFEEKGRQFTFLSRIEGVFSFVRHNPFCHQSLIYHLGALRELGGYDLRYQVSADFDLTYRYVKLHGCRRRDEFIALFSTGGFGRQNQLRSLKERLRSLYTAGPFSVFILALVVAPYVLAKFAAIAILEPFGILRLYRATRSQAHRLMGYRNAAIAAVPCVVMLGVRIHASRIPESGAVSFVNPYSLVKVAHSNIPDGDLDRIIFYSDGIFLCLLARVCYGVPVRRLSFDFSSIAGDVLSLADREGKRMAVIGGTETTSGGFARYIAEHYPGIEQGLVRNGYFASSAEMQELADMLAARSPDIVLLGMGGGMQEQFAVQIVRAGFQGQVYTCGGFLDQTVTSGGRYYPRWISAMNLRWLYRLIREPRRLFLRYVLEYPRFLVLLLRYGKSRP